MNRQDHIRAALAKLRRATRLTELESPEARRARLQCVADAAEYQVRANAAQAAGKISDAASYRGLARALTQAAGVVAAFGFVLAVTVGAVRAQAAIPYLMGPRVHITPPKFRAPHFDAHGNRARRHHHERERFGASPHIIDVTRDGPHAGVTSQDLDAIPGTTEADIDAAAFKIWRDRQQH